MTRPTRLCWRAIGVACGASLSLAVVFSAPAPPDRAAQLVVGGSRLVSADVPQIPHAETFLALNARKPTQLLAASMVYEDGVSTSAVYASHDGGRTWTRARAAPGVPPPAGGDPVLDFDTTGTAFVGAIKGHPDGFRVWRSTDGGLTWNDAVRVPGGVFDRPYLAVDRSAGRTQGRLYAAGAVTVSKGAGQASSVIATTYSGDGGRTFSPTVLVDPAGAAPGGGFGGIADVLVTARGHVIVPFVSGPRIATIVSTDGGKSYGAPRLGPRVGRGSGYRALKTLGAPRAALDRTAGPFAGRLYVAWIDFAADRYDVKVTHTDDAGETWSFPVRVNDNHGPNDPANPAIAVNADGILLVTFNDRRDDPNNDCYRLYAAASLDGGQSFLPNARVRETATCTQASGNWPGLLSSRLRGDAETGRLQHVVGMAGVPERFPNGGDTQGLAAGPDGRFHAAWINGESGVTQLWYTDFEIRGVRPPTETVVHDYTADVEVLAQAPLVDFAAKTMRFRVAVRNQSTAAIPAPLVLVLEQLDGAVAGLTAANSDNGYARAGATWRVPLDGRGLGPGEQSADRELRFAFDGTIPAEPDVKGRFVGHFRVVRPGPAQ